MGHLQLNSHGDGDGVFHTATRTRHIIDHADTRRNRPTINALYGNETAVLMGDWLYMSAFETSPAERSFRS